MSDQLAERIALAYDACEDTDNVGCLAILRSLLADLAAHEAAKPAPVAGLHFRKKPVVIEAMQWDGSWDSLEAIKAKFPAMEVGATTLHPPSKKVYSWSVRTLEGSHQVSVGDWIIKGVKGEFYPCKPDIFAMTYDPTAAPVAVASPVPTQQALAMSPKQTSGTSLPLPDMTMPSMTPDGPDGAHYYRASTVRRLLENKGEQA